MVSRSAPTVSAPARRAEIELSYAEVKAIASGNPAVLTLAEADAELQRLNLLKKNHMDEQLCGYLHNISYVDSNVMSDRIIFSCPHQQIRLRATA